jgi:hypothetical protein
MSAIVLLSCVKSKRGRPCKAGEMYTSPLFQKMMAYAQSLNPQSIFILSAKYGLLEHRYRYPIRADAQKHENGRAAAMGVAMHEVSSFSCSHHGNLL